MRAKRLLKNKRLAAILVIVIIAIILLSHFGYKLGFNDLKLAIQSQGIKGQIIYVIYTMCSVPILTLPSFPLWPLVYVSFGYFPAVVLTSIGVILGSSINFYIARLYGKKLVIKIVGEKKFLEIEGFIGVDDPKTFLILRIFGHNVFDLISYVAGFSNLKFRYYILITSVVTFIWLLFGFIIIDQIIRMPSVLTGFAMILGYVITLFTAGYVIKENQRRQKLKLQAIKTLK